MVIKPFKKTLPLGAGETATSFAPRVSTLWRAPSSTLFWEDVGVPFRSIERGEEEAIRALATATGASFEELMGNSLVRVDRATYRIGDEIILARDFARGRVRACLACLRADIENSPGLRPDQAVFGRLVCRPFRSRHAANIDARLPTLNRTFPAISGITTSAFA